MWIILSVIIIIGLVVVVFINQPRFGRTPKGERKERITHSPNYHDGSFKNLNETPQITTDKGFIGTLADFLFKKKERLIPEVALPVIKSNLSDLNVQDDLLVWLGHSTYILQADGKRILVDPVLSGAASPVSFINKPFKGTDVYRPQDIPEIDYLIISHDHWDHLDYNTVMELKPRIGKVICGLGVGEHFERWGFDKSRIIELDWNESSIADTGFTFHCLPARHFSGRGLSPNQSLWASFLVQTPTQNIFIGGDGGYDSHFAEIGNRFGNIDLAILENGQYDLDWRYIHMLPEQIIQAFKDLNAKRLLTVHHSKFALGNHPWDEPLKKITEAAERDSVPLLAPMIGEVVSYNGELLPIKKWWEGIK